VTSRVVQAAQGTINADRAVLSGMSDADIINYSIPNAIPLIYEFDEHLKPISNYYLLDEKTFKERTQALLK
jgi:2,3-bisphosphoglycerate-dependent phosphoglycerate mutase